MKLSSGIQEALVALLLYDEKHAPIVAGLLPAAVYDPFYKDLIQSGIEYLDKYQKAAGEHALDIVDTLKARKPDDASTFERIFASLEATKADVNPQYVLSEATHFARYQRLKTGLAEAVQALNRNDALGVGMAENALSQALTQTFDLFDPGAMLSDPVRMLRFLDEDNEAFPTGIPELDRVGMGPARSRLHILAGHTGSGKSWWLVHLAKMALIHGKRVVYLSLELSEHEVAMRLIQSFFSMTKYATEVKSVDFTEDEDGEFDGWKTTVLTDRPHFKQKKIRTKLTKKLEFFKNRARFFIKNFPSGTLTIPMLRSYLASLEAAQGFIPDLLIIDYPNEMDHSPANKRLELIKIVTDIRGIAIEKNIAAATVAQLNDEGGRARTPTKHHFAEAKGMVAVADVAMTYAQTQEEFELGLARLFVTKGRSDADKFTVLISQAYAMGQFVVNSRPMSKSYWDIIDDSEVDDDTMDDDDE